MEIRPSEKGSLAHAACPTWEKCQGMILDAQVWPVQTLLVCAKWWWYLSRGNHLNCSASFWEFVFIGLGWIGRKKVNCALEIPLCTTTKSRLLGIDTSRALNRLQDTQESLRSISCTTSPWTLLRKSAPDVLVFSIWCATSLHHSDLIHTELTQLNGQGKYWLYYSCSSIRLDDSAIDEPKYFGLAESDPQPGGAEPGSWAMGRCQVRYSILLYTVYPSYIDVGINMVAIYIVCCNSAFHIISQGCWISNEWCPKESEGYIVSY